MAATPQLKRRLLAAAGLSAAAGVAALGRHAREFARGRRQEDLAWARGHHAPLADVGAVSRLRILPLIDWVSGRDDLQTEPGLSLLVQADETHILFDLGLNAAGQHPSPLLQNMEKLGIALADIDMVFVSHALPDHLGGSQHRRQGTFSPSAGPADFRGVPAYVPEALHHPGARTVVVDRPTVLTTGVASMGPLYRQLLFYGWTAEQSLAVHVRGRGMVLICGGSRPSLAHILGRAEMLFSRPVVGLVGGFHFPVTAAPGDLPRWPAGPLPDTARWPWEPVGESEVLDAIDILQQRPLQLVAPSSHDSCDWSLHALADAFGSAYRPLRVGEEIELSAR